MSQKSTRWLLAAVQAILGWEWLVSGGNKLLSGTFPQGLADTLSEMFKDNSDGWYVSLLQHMVLPRSVFYGYLIEWTEVLIGIILLGSAVVLLSQPRRKGQPQYRLALLYSSVAMFAALLGTFLTVNFHFLAGGGIIPWFDGSAPNEEGIDLDALLPPFELVVLVAQGALLAELTQVSWRQRLRRLLPGRHQPAKPPVVVGDSAS